MVTPSEKCLLLEFASVLNKLCDVDVILDISSIVAINNVGGYNAWVATNMEAADKILIIATLRYIELLGGNHPALLEEKSPHLLEGNSPNLLEGNSPVNCGGDDHFSSIQKLLTEKQCLEDLIAEGRKDLDCCLALCLGMDEKHFQFPLKVETISFPRNFDANCDLNFKHVIEMILR